MGSDCICSQTRKPSRFETCCSGILTVWGKRRATGKDTQYGPAGFQRFHFVPRTWDEAQLRPAGGILG